MNMNFVQFARTYKAFNNELTKFSENVIPRIFPTYSPNPKGPNFGLYCKYQLLRYKPWRTTQNNAWGDQKPTDEALINYWHEFLQTSYGQSNVPDWFDKLQNVIQSQEREDEPSQEQEVTREEWMVLSDLHTPFENAEGIPESAHDWHLDRVNYSEQQIREMPTWIETKKEDYTIDEQYVVDINSFSEMQKLAYDIVKSHFDDASSEKESLCTGKSYLINAIRNLLQGKCAVTATTGKAAYNIKGVTVHSLLKLPIGSSGNKDLTGQTLCRLQENLNNVEYIIIDEYSMLGQVTFGWIDKLGKQATGCNSKVFGGKSLILTGDPDQLPPVADKPLYHSKPSNAVGEQGYQAYDMFDKVIKLAVNQRVQGMSSEQVKPVVFLTKGAIVMLTMNLWPSVGLCNGATGTIVDFIFENNHQPPDLPIAVIVKFENYRGPVFDQEKPMCIPICPITSQGLTLPKAWIDVGKSERTAGVSYVAISRVKSLASCVIEPMTYERLTSLKSSANLQYRLAEETRLDQLAQSTSSA
ncbi:ATP-dependent DNA helicase PIF1 [Paramuricea clavata]|uniref:ATP-dependent DNA helicase n=1 Tax=Paramuricea clavata TaxID=317549 RepID=A0A6S7GQT3_PARCT|nr:ATP-dependent DNA helicase PIF1 [Paramuricea clavata]